jgi:hypothetical protein
MTCEPILAAKNFCSLSKSALLRLKGDTGRPVPPYALPDGLLANEVTLSKYHPEHALKYTPCHTLQLQRCCVDSPHAPPRLGLRFARSVSLHACCATRSACSEGACANILCVIHNGCTSSWTWERVRLQTAVALSRDNNMSGCGSRAG